MQARPTLHLKIKRLSTLRNTFRVQLGTRVNCNFREILGFFRDKNPFFAYKSSVLSRVFNNIRGISGIPQYNAKIILGTGKVKALGNFGKELFLEKIEPRVGDGDKNFGEISNTNGMYSVRPFPSTLGK